MNDRSPSVRQLALAALVLLVAVLASFGTALEGGFVWDDAPLIVENSRVKVPAEYARLFFSSFWETGDGHDRFRAFFRPLVSVSYAVDYAIWGLRPFGYHLTNLALHLLCCVLVYLIAIDYRIESRYALLAGLVFAAHPVHVESVAWISGRTDLLCALLVLAAFLAYRRGAHDPGRRRHRLASWGLFLAALFCKEMAVTLPLLVFFDRRFAGDETRRALRSAAPFLVVFAVYFFARMRVLGDPAPPIYDLGIVAWTATAVFAMARYLTLLIIPIGLDAHYPYPPLETLTQPLAWVSIVMLGTAALGAGWLWSRSRTAVFWVLWVFVGLAPVMAFGRFGDVIMADRFLYLPSAGLCLLVAFFVRYLFERSSSRRGWAVVALALLIVTPLALASRQRSRVWKDDRTLFADMLTTSPDSALVRNNLGLALYRDGELEPAIEEFRLAVALQPNYAMAHNNLGAALERRGWRRQATTHYLRAVELAPGSMQPERNLAHLMVRSGQVDDGRQRLERLAELHPRSSDVLYALADVRYSDGAADSAIDYLAQALENDPWHAESYYLLGKIRFEQGDLIEAAQLMTRFLELWSIEGINTDAARRIVAQAALASEG